MPVGFFQIDRSVKSPRAWRCRKRDRHFLEIPMGDFWTERNTNKSWKLGTHKQVNCKWKIGRIELAKLSLQIWASISLLQNRFSTGINFPVLERYYKYWSASRALLWKAWVCDVGSQAVWLQVTIRIINKTLACRELPEYQNGTRHPTGSTRFMWGDWPMFAVLFHYIQI